MATTRKIKEAKDISSGELIYFKGHAKATYMTDGRTVEDAINNINQSGSGGEGSSSKGNAYQLVNHGTSDITFALTPNCFHVWDEVGSLTLTIGDEIAGVANEYIFQFISGSESTTLILPDSIKFNSDFTIEANKIYQISILHGLGTVMSWDNESPLQFPINLIYGDNGELGKNVYKYLLNEYGETSFTLKEEITVDSFPLTNGLFSNSGEGVCFFFSESWGYAEIYDNGKVNYMED